jgi:uncharacterized protein
MTSNETFLYALVAGGSTGIGYSIAEALARRKFNLILVGRKQESLLDVKNNLEASYSIRVETLVYDLSKQDSAQEIAAWCAERQIPLTILCNVASLGGEKDYLSLPLESLRYMIDLNLNSCVSLCTTLLPLLERNAPSYIMNVGSIAGYSPIPSKNLYSATKSAIAFFSYSLRYQLKNKGISVSCVTPGPVFTKESIETDTRKRLGWFGVQMAVDQKRVGEIAVLEMLKGKLLITPGLLAKAVVTIIRILPARFLAFLDCKVGKEKYS